MMILKQLAIVFALLVSLPLAVMLLWKLRLLPLVLYFAATKLFFPKWAVGHGVLCLSLLIVSVLFAVLAWAIRIYRWKQEQRYCEARLLATAKPLYRVTDRGEIVPVSNGE